MRLFILSLCLAALVAACSSSDSFTLGGTVAGNPNMNLYARYYGNGKVVAPVVRVAEGKFQFSGVSRTPTLVELYDNEGRALGYILAGNGDELSLTIDRANPFLMQASGTEPMEKWTALANANAETLFAGTDSAVNALVESEVRENPTSLASALLFITAYRKNGHQAAADSVAALLDPSVRLSSLFDPYLTLQSHYSGKDYAAPVDSFPYVVFEDPNPHHFSPKGYGRTLLAFCTNYQDVYDYRRDSLVPALKEVAKNKDVQIIDFYLTSDSINFRTTVRNDSVAYARAWAPGGIFAKGIDRLAVPATPFYIVTDSAGAQIYRGSKLWEAKAAALQ